MSESTATMPTIPTELWALWSGTAWVPTFDCNPGHDDPLLVFTTEDEAKDGAAYQKDLYGVDSIPVRIK
jgi:hypothetical protein